MLKHFYLGIFAALALAAAAPATASAQSNLVLVPDGDPEMATAVTKARASLPTFWKAFEHPGVGEEGFALKVAIKDGSDVEHFWLWTSPATATSFRAPSTTIPAWSTTSKTASATSSPCGPNLGLAVPAQRQDGRQRDHAAAPEANAEGRSRRLPRHVRDALMLGPRRARGGW